MKRHPFLRINQYFLYLPRSVKAVLSFFSIMFPSDRIFNMVSAIIITHTTIHGKCVIFQLGIIEHITIKKEEGKT